MAELDSKKDTVVIRIHGECQESVVITRNDVTLEGADEDAAIVVTDGSAVTIAGASHVALEGLRVSSAFGTAILVERSEVVSLDGMAVTGTGGDGLEIVESGVVLSDSSFTDCAQSGIAAWGGSVVALGGTFIDASHNTDGAGLLASASTVRLVADTETQLTTNHNLAGVWAQLGASVEIPATVASNNAAVGLRSIGNSVLFGRRLVEVEENQYGVYVSAQSLVELFEYRIDLNLVGIRGHNNAMFQTHEATLDDNVYYGAWFTDEAKLDLWNVACNGTRVVGLLLHGAALAMANVALENDSGVEIQLEFGSRALFEFGNSAGLIQCDPTVLVEGDLSCSPAQTGASAATSVTPDLWELSRIDHTIRRQPVATRR